MHIQPPVLNVHAGRCVFATCAVGCWALGTIRKALRRRRAPGSGADPNGSHLPPRSSCACSALRRALDGQSFGCYPAEWPSSALGSPMSAAGPCGHGQCMPLSACQRRAVLQLGCSSATAGPPMALRCAVNALKRPEWICKAQQAFTARFAIGVRKPLRRLPPSRRRTWRCVTRKANGRSGLDAHARRYGVYAAPNGSATALPKFVLQQQLTAPTQRRRRATGVR